MTASPPPPSNDDVHMWGSLAKVPDGDDGPGGLSEPVPWQSFALDGYELVISSRTRRSVVERILDLVDRVQHTG
jgi:hypothetical protein